MERWGIDPGTEAIPFDACAKRVPSDPEPLGGSQDVPVHLVQCLEESSVGHVPTATSVGRLPAGVKQDGGARRDLCAPPGRCNARTG
jgi:hypothetical protein